MFRYGLLLIFGFLFLMAQPAIGKPKKLINGCTAEQLQLPRASACIDQMQKDLQAGHAYPHFVMCDETGMYCCQGDDTRTFNCKAIRATNPSKNFPFKLPEGTVAPPMH